MDGLRNTRLFCVLPLQLRCAKCPYILPVRFLPSPCLEVTLSFNLSRSMVCASMSIQRKKEEAAPFVRPSVLPTVRHFRCQSILPRILNCPLVIPSFGSFVFLLDNCLVLYAHVTFVQLDAFTNRPKSIGLCNLYM